MTKIAKLNGAGVLLNTLSIGIDIGRGTIGPGTFLCVAAFTACLYVFLREVYR